MVAFSPDMRKRLATTEPRGGEALPAMYSKIGTAKRAAVREQYIELQDGLCYHCHAPLDGPCSVEVAQQFVDERRFPPYFFTRPIHLHHDHDTDLTIGAVHAHCNAVLFQYHGE